MKGIPARFLGWKKTNGAAYSRKEWESIGLPDWPSGKLLSVEYRPHLDDEIPYFVFEYEVYAGVSEIELIEHKPLVAEDWL